MSTDLTDQLWLTLPDVAERLDLTVAQVRTLVQERRLVATRRGPNRVLNVPASFLVPGHLANPASPQDPATSPTWAVLASLQGTLTVLGDVGFDDDGAVAWLLTPDDQLGAAPIDALRAGRKTEVRRRAAVEL